MASTYKTPGVYVEEISKFPPSVAANTLAYIGKSDKFHQFLIDNIEPIPDFKFPTQEECVDKMVDDIIEKRFGAK